MNLKQRFSVLTATVLPLLALSAFLFIGPAKAHADGDCADGGIPTNGEGMGCNNGAGGIYAFGTNWGAYVFCSDGMGGEGTGYCDIDGSGCVICNGF